MPAFEPLTFARVLTMATQSLIRAGTLPEFSDDTNGAGYQYEQRMIRRFTVVTPPADSAHVDHIRVSYLPLADFRIFNDTYNPAPADDPRDCCSKCNGAGGSTYAEYQGDPPMGAVVDFFEQCEDCVCAGLCPGCMQPLAYTFDYSALGEDTPIVKRATGWFYAANSGVKTIEVIQPPALTHRDGSTYTYATQTYGVYEYNAYQFDAFDAMAMIYLYSWFNCSVCGWQYDPDRHNDSYYDDGDQSYGKAYW